MCRVSHTTNVCCQRCPEAERPYQWGFVMREYRVYVFDDNGTLVGPAMAVPASNDDDAISYAAMLRGVFAAELRDGLRLIEKFPAKQDVPLPAPPAPLVMRKRTQRPIPHALRRGLR
jgi:hypothetical protein